MIKDVVGRDLEHACASKGTFSCRLYDVVTDVFSNCPLDTLECEGSDKLHLKLFVGIALSPAEATCTKGGCDCTCEPDRETSVLPAHVVTILDKVDQKGSHQSKRENRLVQCGVMAARVARVVCKGPDWL